MNTMVRDILDRAERAQIPWTKLAREANMSVQGLYKWRHDKCSPTLSKLVAVEEAIDRIERRRKGE